MTPVSISKSRRKNALLKQLSICKQRLEHKSEVMAQHKPGTTHYTRAKRELQTALTEIRKIRKMIAEIDDGTLETW